MLKVTSIKEIFEKAGQLKDQSVVTGGWIRTARRSKNVGFIELYDGTCFQALQVVYSPDLPGVEEVDALITGSCIIVTGKLVHTPDGKQAYELQAEKIDIEGSCDPSYPLQKKRHGFEYLRTIPHLRPRTTTFSAVFRVRSVLTFAIHKFLCDRGFVNVTTPCITTSDCEGAGETFRITTIDPANPPKNEDGTVNYKEDFFGKKTYMTVSGQLNVEPFALALRNVYTFGPSFRAENSNTPRHAAEFWQVEPEMAFCDLDGLIETIEAMSKYIIKFVMDHCPDELAFFDKFIEPGLIAKLEKTVSCDFARITHKEAIRVLKESGKQFEVPVTDDGSIQTEYERYLAEEYFGRPVFVTDYPKNHKAFYMKVNDDNETVAATDLLFPGLGEIVGASEREARYDVLLQRINEMGLDPEEYGWYLDLRRFGTATHSGFGMGVERMMRFITGIDNIRDVIAYPRTPKNAEF